MTGPLLRPCCFFLTIFNPPAVTAGLLAFFDKRDFTVESLHMQLIDKGKAILQIQTSLPKDKIRYISSLILKIECVDNLQVLEGRE
ncbi:MAG: hypothetical protein ABUT20_15090 [Bacteroidota bacterium]